MHRLAARARRAFGLFGVVWLAVSITPCAMAFGGGHGCPHCPPEISDTGEAHHGHHSETAADAGCDTLQSQCGDLDDVSFDGRGGQSKAKSPVELPAVLAPSVAGDAVCRAIDRYPGVDPPLRRYSPPAINLLFCVFLD